MDYACPELETRLGVTVYDDSMVEELIIDGQDHIKTVPMIMSKSDAQKKRSRVKRPMSTPISSKSRQDRMDTTLLQNHALQLQAWLSDKSFKSLQEKADIESREARQLYDTILQEENSFVKGLDDLLKHSETLNLRKKELLHKKWSERVYEPLMGKIIEVMDSTAYPHLAYHKHLLYKQYLEHVNKKGHVFLDTFSPNEYYPMTLNSLRPAPLVAKTGTLQDPLLAQEQARYEEDRVIIQCVTGAKLTNDDIDRFREVKLPPLPLGRKFIQSSDWLELPMGNIESPVRLASRARMKLNSRNDSQVELERWAVSPPSDSGRVSRAQSQVKPASAETRSIGTKPSAIKAF